MLCFACVCVPSDRHENRNGFYAVGAYYTAKVLLDLIPLRVIPAAVFSAIMYFMIGRCVCVRACMCARARVCVWLNNEYTYVGMV